MLPELPLRGLHMTLREMAASGLGWEDIVASLRREGVACDEAAIRSYVLGRKWK